MNNLRFAEGIAFITETQQQSQKLFEKADQESVRYGQKISQTKKERMRARPKAGERRDELVRLRRQIKTILASIAQTNQF